MDSNLLAIHAHSVRGISLDKKRYLYSQINWDSRALCLAGARGTGKTTMLLQYYLETYNDPGRCLYLSADNIQVMANGLFAIAGDYFAHGGEALIIDEVHKYPGWSQEVKNIFDTFKDKKIMLSGSSTLDLTRARHDLSRRVVYHSLVGLSFREYLDFSHNIVIQPLKLPRLLEDHPAIAADLLGRGPMLKYFSEYLKTGYYPFFLEGRHDYESKVLGVIEKVLFEDVSVSYNLPQAKIPVLKKILWLIATSHPFQLNIDGLASDLGVSRPSLYNYLDILETGGLLRSLNSAARGAKRIRKPGKLLFDNTNLLFAIAGSFKDEASIGTLRETFFASQLSLVHKLSLHAKADFLVDNRLVFEIGGPAKGKKQIAGRPGAYLVQDGIEIGFAETIPLYLFGFLY